MGEKDPLHRKMRSVWESGQRQYEPRSPEEARRLLKIESGNFVISDDLEKTLNPRGLDGNKSTFTPAEKRAWTAFQIKYGVISPFGGYVFDPKMVLSDPEKSAAELKALFKSYQARPHRPAQWVWIKVENWDELLSALGLGANEKTELRSRIIKTLAEAYRAGDKSLNIRFTFDKPTDAKRYQEVYLGTDPNGSVGSYLNEAGDAEVFEKVVDEMWCRGDNFSLPRWTNEFPLSQLQVLLKVEIWKYQLAHYGTPDLNTMDAIWNAPPLLTLRQKINPSQLPASVEGLGPWMVRETERLAKTQDYREKSAFTQSLGYAAEGVVRDFIRSEQAKGGNLEEIKARLIAWPLFPELLAASYWMVNGMAVMGCDSQDVGNQDLGGLLIVNAPKENSKFLPSEVRFQRMIKTVIHEIGHLLGLEHHYVTTIGNRPAPTHTVMVDGNYRNDTISHYEFLPENVGYLRAHLGLR